MLALLVSSQIFLGDCAGKWVLRAPMPTKRSDASAGTVGNKIIIAGGCDTDQICPQDLDVCICTSVTSKAEAYLPDVDQWTTLPSMPQARFRHASAVVGNNLYVLGGRDVNDTIIQSLDVYHSDTNTWETLPSSSIWTDASSDLVAVSIGSYIYAISGYTQDYSTKATVSIFDTNSLEWQPIQLPSMIVSRGDACAVVIDQLIYVFGGFNDQNFCSALDSLEVFDTVSNKWSTKHHLDQPRGDAACGSLHGEFHAIAGEQKDNITQCSKYDIPIGHVEHYHPSTDTWTEETPIENVRFRFIGSSYGNTFYVFGGQSGLDKASLKYPVLNTVESWEDTTTESTTTILSFSIVCLILCLLLAP